MLTVTMDPEGREKGEGGGGERGGEDKADCFNILTHIIISV